MSFAAGVAQQLSERDKNMLASEELNQRNKEEFLNYFSKISKTPKSSSIKSKASVTNDQIQFLQNQGYSDDFLSKVIATENPTVFQTLLSGTNKALTSIKKTQPVEKLPEYMIDSIEKSATFSDPTKFEIDIDKMAKEFGIVITEAEREMLRESLTVPGSATFSDATFTLTEKIDLKDLPPIYKAVVSGTIGKAERELELLNRAIASADENDRGLLAQRKVDIEESLTNVDKNPSKLISLYGNSFAKDMFKYDPKYKEIPMPETFQSSLFEVPLVANEETAIMLVNMGIVNEGTVLRLPSGEEIEVYKSRR
tara:strand:+ start:1492 stop:2424 length:933 start_codon:yes stop_codon:yes gene_type:complete